MTGYTIGAVHGRQKNLEGVGSCRLQGVGMGDLVTRNFAHLNVLRIWKSSIRMRGEPSLGPGTIPSDGATGVRWRFSSDIVFPARILLPHRCFGAMCISMGSEAGMELSMDRNGRWWLGLILAPTRRLSTMALETRINRDHTN